MLRVADMCAGTGSLSAAVAAELGGRVVSVSDTSDVARRVLAARYPEAAVCEDALSQDLSRADAVAVGAPCQDLSWAGRRGGPNLQTAVAEGRHREVGGLLDRWAVLTGRPVVAAVDSAGRLSAGFCEWMMGIPPSPSLSRTARIRLAGNAVVPSQARLALRLAARELLGCGS